MMVDYELEAIKIAQVGFRDGQWHIIAVASGAPLGAWDTLEEAEARVESLRIGIRQAMEATVKAERDHAAALCNAWGHYWAGLYTGKLEPHQMGMMGYALAGKIKEGESLDVVKAAQEQLDIERMPKRRKRL